MKRCTLLMVLIIITSMLTGCDGLLARSTATPTVTNTPQPTATATLTPTPTQTATPTVTPTATAVPPKLYKVPAGGYSFELPQEGRFWSKVEVAISHNQAFIKDSTGDLFIYILTETRDYVLNIDQEVEFLAETTSDTDVEVDPDHYEVAGRAARQLTAWTDFEGEDVFLGMILVDGGGNRLIYILSYVFNDPDGTLWVEDMLPFREKILESFQIFEPENTAPGGFGQVGDSLI